MQTAPRHDGFNPIVLRPANVLERTGLKPTLFAELQNPQSRFYDPTFPRPFSLGGGRARGYLTAEIDAWILARAATRTRGASA